VFAQGGKKNFGEGLPLNMGESPTILEGALLQAGTVSQYSRKGGEAGPWTGKRTCVQKFCGGGVVVVWGAIVNRFKKKLISFGRNIWRKEGKHTQQPFYSGYK